MIDFIAIPWDISAEFRTVVQVGECGDIEISTQMWDDESKSWKRETADSRISIQPKTVDSICKALKVVAEEMEKES